MGSENYFPGFSSLDSMATEDGDLHHRMPVRGESHHAFFDGQGKIDNFHRLLRDLLAGYNCALGGYQARTRYRSDLQFLRHQLTNSGFLYFAANGFRELIHGDVARRLLMLSEIALRADDNNLQDGLQFQAPVKFFESTATMWLLRRSAIAERSRPPPPRYPQSSSGLPRWRPG